MDVVIIVLVIFTLIGIYLELSISPKNIYLPCNCNVTIIYVDIITTTKTVELANHEKCSYSRNFYFPPNFPCQIKVEGRGMGGVWGQD